MTFDPYESKRITPSSKKLYLHNLVKLNDNLPLKTLNYLGKTPSIMQKLDAVVSPNTRRTYLIAVCSALSNTEVPKLKRAYSIYFAKLDELNRELKDNTKMKEKEAENWLSQQEVEDKHTELGKVMGDLKGKKKPTPDQVERLLKYLVLSLYVLLPPRRNKDYVLMKMEAPSDDAFGFYHDKKFFFNNYKTSHTYQQQAVAVPPELQAIIKVWERVRANKESPFMLQRANGKEMKTSTDITSLLQSIFDSKVSSSMLRKIYLTDKYSDVMKEMSKDVEAMATSKETAQTNYIKTE